MKKEDKLLARLKKYIEEDDNEMVHVIYDELIILRLRQYEPSFIRRLNKLIKGINFWYA